MHGTDQQECQRAARAAVVALQQAALARRRHPGQPRLWRTAARAAALAVQKAAVGRPMRLRLDGHSVILGDEVLLHHAADEVPFGQIAGAGVGGIEFTAAFDVAAAERWVEHLAAAPRQPDPDAGPAASWCDVPLPGVRLLAPDRGAGATGTGTSHAPDWWLLPGPHPTGATLRGLVDLDRDANLPVVAARLALADLDEGDTAGIGSTGVLATLFATMMLRGDVVGAAWLLEQAQHHPAIAAGEALVLRNRAAQAFFGEWLPEQLAHGTGDLRPLLSLAMHLGDEGVRHLVATAEAAGCDVPAWLRNGF